jgi:type I restriction-modification system DNA methylase subunit
MNKNISKNMKNLTPISVQALRETFGSTSHTYRNIRENLEALWKEVRDEQSIKAKVDSWASTIRTFYGYEPDISLFLDHTYLNILAKIAVYLKFEKSPPNRDEIRNIIRGKYFTAKGIANFHEEDFSLWLLSPKIEDESLALFCDLSDALANYDFSKIDEDIFREIYEEIVEREERHKAGEYYTPEWLVQLILNDALALWEKKDIPKILDPACGSGTFLYRTIKILLEKGISLRDIIKNVGGIDINPIANYHYKSKLFNSNQRFS